MNLKCCLRSLILGILLENFVLAELPDNLKKLEWIIGKWEGQFHGKVRWPTIPTMTYGEILTIAEAPVAAAAGISFLNYSAVSWSHSTKDHLHDEWGYLGVNRNGVATLMTTGNNGFNKIEEGPAQYGLLVLDLKEIGRISFSRDLPVKNLRRTFRILDSKHMEQVLDMQTDTHPKYDGTQEHARIIYERVA
uniref:THAP4-like heme-binding beta-barrel domain-containing protein n=1 Tax=Plectus sambesii TaxID=2011161 RepID=A0A914WZU1_9BILA